MKACILFSAIGARKRLSGGCVPSRDARQARRRLRYCACTAIIPGCRTRRGGFCLFSYASLAHRCRHSAEQYLAVAMTLRLIDCPQRRYVLASVNHHTPQEGEQRAG
jgi:hypothetical protein